MRNVITQADAKIFKQRLDEYNRKLKEANDAYQDAVGFGDFSENEEYHKAKADIKKYARLKMKLQDLLNADIKSTVSTLIELGSTVKLTIKNCSTGEIEFDREVCFVKDKEAYPEDGYICVDAPIFSFVSGKTQYVGEITGDDNVKRQYTCVLVGEGK